MQNITSVITLQLSKLYELAYYCYIHVKKFRCVIYNAMWMYFFLLHLLKIN